MKKVININFQGRVIPIEESAYDILKQYIESLRRYFSNEDSREEIINDIESRIGELFAERLKKGATCITDDDVNAVIASMGRPEDLEAEDAEINGAKTSQQQGSRSQSSSSGGGSGFNYATRGRLYRNADDKIIAGVCSGLANYLGIDPVIMRIVFVLLIAPLFWVYILLWVIIPSTSIQSNITKRLYRSSEDKVIGGVCGGLSAYFNISPWVPRLIFALPLIIGLISGPFHWWWGGDWDIFWTPKVITGSLGSTLFVTYIILWIALPVAVTSAEKLEMRGERVDLNSIRNTVKEDLSSFKSRAQNFGNEVKETAQQFGEKAKDFGRSASSQAKTFSTEAGSVARRGGSGVGHVIGVLFKAFFLFIAGIVALALFAAFIGILFGGYTFFPLKDFMLEGAWQNLLAWSSLLFFFGIPLLALITWLIRRIIGVRSKNHYLGFVFGGLWTIGLISFILLLGLVGRNFKTRSAVEEIIPITQPRQDRLFVDVVNSNVNYYGGDWFGIEWDEDWPFYGVAQDTLMLTTVRVDVQKSEDDQYHLSTIKLSRGNNPQVARELAQKISFTTTQQDSAVLLPRGFAISDREKFRNQQVVVKIEVPVGKRILLDRSISHFDYFDVRYNRRGGFNFDYDEDWDNHYWLQTGVEYIMTPNGPKRVDHLDPEELAKGNFVPLDREREEVKKEQPDTTERYRYRRDSLRQKNDSSNRNNSKSNTEANGEDELLAGSSSKGHEVATPVTTLLRLFQ
jgi:phage shock protein PspC (stress-responsive transcriptional regulator)